MILAEAMTPSLLLRVAMPELVSAEISRLFMPIIRTAGLVLRFMLVGLVVRTNNDGSP